MCVLKYSIPAYKLNLILTYFVSSAGDWHTRFTSMASRKEKKWEKIHFQRGWGFGIMGGFEVGGKPQQKQFDPDHPHLPSLNWYIWTTVHFNCLKDKLWSKPMPKFWARKAWLPLSLTRDLSYEGLFTYYIDRKMGNPKRWLIYVISSILLIQTMCKFILQQQHQIFYPGSRRYSVSMSP